MAKKQAEVRIYTQPNEYSELAREILTDRNISFREIDVAEDYVLRGWLAWATGLRTLPQTFINGEPIGGFADLMTADSTGDLRRRIGGEWDDIKGDGILRLKHESRTDHKG